MKMKMASKLFAVLVLVGAMYFAANNESVSAATAGCTSGTACQKCQCKYNQCANAGHFDCDGQFYYCVNGDYGCGRPVIGGGGIEPIHN